jgi:hypothetical protein
MPQSARLSVQSSALGLPTPSPASECCFSRFGSLGGGGGDTLASGERGGGTQLKRLARNSGASYILIPLQWRFYPYFIKQASGITLKDDRNGFLYISKMCYIGNNKKLRRERFNSPATSKLVR